MTSPLGLIYSVDFILWVGHIHIHIHTIHNQRMNWVQSLRQDRHWPVGEEIGAGGIVCKFNWHRL